MSLTSQHLVSSSSSRITLFFNKTSSPLRNPNFYIYSSNPRNFQFLTYKSSKSSNSRVLISNRLRAYESEGRFERNNLSPFNVDYIISIAELICLFSSTIVWIGFAMNYAISGSKRVVFNVMAERVLVLGILMLVGGIVMGAWIRRRQWRRICGDVVNGRGKNLNLVERIEKSEEDLRSLATLIRALSRQMEKLGTRFRVTRKAMKEPAAETTALVQKNSETTQALAVQADILEKELGEVQNVLLAMQDQQRKQLELFLAVVKSGKIGESKQEPILGKETNNTGDTRNREE